MVDVADWHCPHSRLHLGICPSKGKILTYYEAMRILDRLKDGWSYPAKIVDQALRMTGDLRENTNGTED